MTKDRLKSACLMMLVLLLGISLAVILYFYQMFYKSDHFLPGVKIASVTVQGYNRQQASLAVQDWVNSVKKTPVTFYCGEYTYRSSMSDLCLAVNAEKTINDIWEEEKQRGWKNKIFNMDGFRTVYYPVKIEYNPVVAERLAAEWSKDLAVEAVNARLEVDKEEGMVIVPGQEGKIVDIDSTLAGLPQEWEEFDSIKTPITLENVAPLIDESDLEPMGEISSFTTWYNSGDINRSRNLQLAAEAINGLVLAPDSIFSFNQTVGERIYASGYRDALVIVNGRFEPGLGGGVCQVSSTLYNACLLAGMEIVERHNHGLAVAYVPLGRDATVVYGLQDFKFANKTNGPVYIRAIAEAGKLAINIYGDLSYKKKIELSHIVDRVIDFQEIREVAADLQTGEEKIDHEGFPGYVVRSFRTYYDDSGEIIKQEKLATDSYRPLHKLVYIGPPEEGELPSTSVGTGEDEAGQNLPEELTGNDENPEKTPELEGEEAEIDEALSPENGKNNSHNGENHNINDDENQTNNN